MGRWQPGARERLVKAAVDLFADQGYDATTVMQIAERAGVTKSTFFRHFADKRDLLVAGQETMATLLAGGVASAPASATPLEAVAAGLLNASSAFGETSREIAPRISAIVAGNAELEEREALKSATLATTMTDALMARGAPLAVAAVAAEIGILAFKQGFATWSAGDRRDDFGAHAVRALDELKAAAAALS